MVRTLRRATSGLNWGFDGQVGVGAILPNMRAPDLSLTLEGYAPNDAGFINKLVNANAFAEMPPVTDPNFTDTYTYLATASVTDNVTISGIVFHAGLAPRRLQFTLSDAGLELSAEYAVADVSLANGVITYDSTNSTVTARQIQLLNATYAESTYNINEVAQTVLEDVFPPDVARTAGIVNIVDANGNPFDLIPTRMQINIEFNGTIAYSVTKSAVPLHRLVPYITVELELAPDMLSPADKFKAGIVKGASTSKLGIAGFLEIDMTNYIVQTGDFEVSDDFTNPRITIIPMKYSLKDGNGNVVAGWL